MNFNIKDFAETFKCPICGARNPKLKIQCPESNQGVFRYECCAGYGRPASTPKKALENWNLAVMDFRSHFGLAPGPEEECPRASLQEYWKCPGKEWIEGDDKCKRAYWGDDYVEVEPGVFYHRDQVPQYFVIHATERTLALAWDALESRGEEAVKEAMGPLFELIKMEDQTLNVNAKEQPPEDCLVPTNIAKAIYERAADEALEKARSQMDRMIMEGQPLLDEEKAFTVAMAILKRGNDVEIRSKKNGLQVLEVIKKIKYST